MRTSSLFLAASAAVALGAAPALSGEPKSLDWEKTVARKSWGAGKTARVHVVAFGDFECPFCARAEAALAELGRRYPKDVRFTFVDYPLGFHPNAHAAATAATAAALQGRFRAFADALFADPKALQPEAIEAKAKAAKLDMARFRRDLQDPRLAAFVDRSIQAAAAVGVTGTPNFFVNGKPLRGAQPVERFVELVDAELAIAKETRGGGERFARARTKENHPALHAILFEGADPGTVEPPPKPGGAAGTRAVEDPSKVWKVVVDAGDPALGPADALVTLVVFSDFQCPFCQRLVPVLDALAARYDQDLRIVFKQNPLPFHDRAMPAALASLCAHEQGAFWPMHAELFAERTRLGDEDLAAHAAALRLDGRWFASCLSEARPAAKVRADMDLARKLGARGTPTSFVNGVKLVGAQPEDAFVRAVEAALPAAKSLVEAGTPREKLYDAIVAGGAETAEAP